MMLITIIIIIITIAVIFITKETCQKYILSSAIPLSLLTKQLKTHFLVGVGQDIIFVTHIKNQGL